MNPILPIGFLFSWFFASAMIGHMSIGRGRSSIFWLTASLIFSPFVAGLALLVAGKTPEARADEYAERIEAKAAEYLDLQDAVRRQRSNRLSWQNSSEIAPSR